jgi:hypothetical protein
LAGAEVESLPASSVSAKSTAASLQFDSPLYAEVSRPRPDLGYDVDHLRERNDEKPAGEDRPPPRR